MTTSLADFLISISTKTVDNVIEFGEIKTLLSIDEELPGNWELTLPEKSNLKLYILSGNMENLLNINWRIVQKNNSSLEIFWVLNNSLTTEVSLEIEVFDSCQTILNTLILARDSSNFSLNMKIIHLGKKSVSKQFSKTVLEDNSVIKLTQEIEIAKNTKNNMANLTNKNLILSSQAALSTKPILKIKSKEVECGHEASSLILEENELFYFQTRGFTKKEALHLTKVGFLNEFVSKIDLICFKDKVLASI